jgi:hypothetical protein
VSAEKVSHDHGSAKEEDQEPQETPDAAARSERPLQEEREAFDQAARHEAQGAEVTNQ